MTKDRATLTVAANLGHVLRSAGNDVIDLAPLFGTFEIIKVQDAPAQTSHRTHQQRETPSSVSSEKRWGGV